MIMRRSALVGMLVACCMGAPAFSIVRAQAVPYAHAVQAVRAKRAATNLSVQTVSHGIRLTLMLPKRVFGADEIAGMTVRIQNLSRRSLVPDVSCDMQNPRVEVQARSGFIL